MRRAHWTDRLGLDLDLGEPWRSEADGAMPTRQIPMGPRVPDLTRIAQDRWGDVLGALSEAHRRLAAEHPGLGARLMDADGLVETLPPAPSDVARAALDGAPSFPVPRVQRARRGRQLNLRLTDGGYADLEVAAKLVGAKPTQIARMLVLNGVRRVLAEHDAAIASARRGAT